MKTRGIVNNNPANIRKSSSRWKGLVKASPSGRVDTQFCQFESMEYGVRALLALLRTYYLKYRLRDVKSIVSRFAPSSDGNNTREYINSVCASMCVSENTYLKMSWAFPLDRDDVELLERVDTLYSLAYMICRIESKYILTYDMFLTALYML